MLDFINHSSRKEPNLHPHAGFAEKHSQVLLTSHTWASESAANLASHDSLHYSHIQTAYTSQPIYTEPFMNAFFPFSPCIVGVSLYWRWETHFLHWSAFMFSTWEYNKKKERKDTTKDDITSALCLWNTCPDCLHKNHIWWTGF